MTSTVPSTQELSQRLMGELPQFQQMDRVASRGGSAGAFTGAAIATPAQAGNLDVQRDVSATNRISDPMAFQYAEDRLTNMVGSDSRFMREARRTGLEQAATRGVGNSSIAAGASMREALRAAAPIAQQDAGFTQTEFGRGMQARYQDELAGNSLIRDMDKGLFQLRGQNALDQNALMRDVARMNAEGTVAEQRAAAQMMRDMDRSQFQAGLENQAANASTMRTAVLNQLDFQFRNQMAENDTFRQNWMNEQSSFRGMMEQAYSAELGLNAGMLDRLGAAFVSDPEVYNPQVVSGMLNFFRGQATGIVNQTIANVIGDRVGTSTPPPQAPRGASELGVIRTPPVI